jgi:uncharacterized membrane protein
MADRSMNLTVPRGDKSVWDTPTLKSTLATFDQERWFALGLGSAISAVGTWRGGFTGGLLTAAGAIIAIRAAMGRHDLRLMRGWIDRALTERGWRRVDIVEDASADSFPASDSPSWTADSGATINR